MAQSDERSATSINPPTSLRARETDPHSLLAMRARNRSLGDLSLGWFTCIYRIMVCSCKLHDSESQLVAASKRRVRDPVCEVHHFLRAWKDWGGGVKDKNEIRRDTTRCLMLLSKLSSAPAFSQPFLTLDFLPLALVFLLLFLLLFAKDTVVYNIYFDLMNFLITTLR